MSLSESHCEKGNIPDIFCSYSHFREQYSLEITSGLSWHNYIRPKKKDSCVQVSEVKKIRVGRSKTIFILDYFFITNVQRL